MDIKAYSVAYKNENNYLHVLVEGEEDSQDISIAYWEEITEECYNRGFENIVVEEKFENQVSVMDMYNICVRISELSIKYKLKIAFIDQEAEHKQMNQFGAIVANNRGSIGCILNSVEEAEKWFDDANSVE